jgi:hypothetical protein
LFQRRLYAAWLIWNYSLQLILSSVTPRGGRRSNKRGENHLAGRKPAAGDRPERVRWLGHPMTQHEMVDGRRRDKTARWLASE